MSLKKPTIGLFFAGGTEVAGPARTTLAVNSEKDLDNWLEVVPEISIVGNIKPVLVRPEKDATSSVALWQEIGKKIWELRDQIDGAVILHKTPQLSYLTSALAVQLPAVNFPIVATGSHLSLEKGSNQRQRLYQTLGVKANLINAVQTASLDVAGSSLLYNSDIYYSTDVTREGANTNRVFTSFSGAMLGRVELGVALNPGYRRRSDAGQSEFHPEMEGNISVVHWTPGATESLVQSVDPDKHAGLIVRGEPEAVQEEGFKKFVSRFSHVPVFFYHPRLEAQSNSSLVPIFGMPFETAVARVMSALGRNVAFASL